MIPKPSVAAPALALVLLVGVDVARADEIERPKAPSAAPAAPPAPAAPDAPPPAGAPAEPLHDADEPVGLEESPPPPAAFLAPSGAPAPIVYQREAETPSRQSSAPPADTVDEDDLPTAELGTYQTHFMATLGVRTAFIPNEGLDPFAGSDTLVQTTLGVGRTLLASGPFSVAAIGLWDVGEREASARGALASLTVHRFTAGAEFRYHIVPWLYGFLRPMPALLHTRAALADGTTGEELRDRSWLFGFDATAGAAVQLIGRRSGNARRVRLWLAGEGGYGWSTSTDLAMKPDEDSGAPVRLADLDLGSLAIRGGMFRVSANLTF